MNRVTSKPLKIDYYLDFLLYCQSNVQLTSVLMNIRNCTFLVHFGGMSGEFGRAVIRILVRCSQAKTPKARPNEPDIVRNRFKGRHAIIFHNYC